MTLKDTHPYTVNFLKFLTSKEFKRHMYNCTRATNISPRNKYVPWLRENISNRYAYTDECIHFTEEADAIHFKIVHG